MTSMTDSRQRTMPCPDWCDGTHDGITKIDKAEVVFHDSTTVSIAPERHSDIETQYLYVKASREDYPGRGGRAPVVLLATDVAEIAQLTRDEAIELGTALLNAAAMVDRA